MVGIHNFIAYLKYVHAPPETSIIVEVLAPNVKGVVGLNPTRAADLSFVLQKNARSSRDSSLCHR